MTALFWLGNSSYVASSKTETELAETVYTENCNDAVRGLLFKEETSTLKL